VTTDKATLSVPELTNAYVQQPKGSALILDEAEAGASKYESGTASNKALRKLVSMGRIEEKYVIMNLPNSGEMDRDLRALSDVWVIVTSKGSAKCNILGYNPWGEHPTVADDHPFKWSDIPTNHPLRDVYNKLTEQKRKRLRGEKGDGYIPRHEAEEQREQARKESRIETRNELVQDMYRTHDDLSQQDIADAVGLSQSQVGNVLRGD